MSRGYLPLLLGALVFLGGAAPAPSPAPAQQQVLRLHIVANSNRPDDIAAKVAVRTALLGFLQGRIEGAASAGAAARRLEGLTPAMQRIADETLRGYGLTYRAKVALGTAALPRRGYLGQTLGAGRYLTLEVVLGAGHGQNWWCLLFPEICLSDGGAAVGAAEGAAASPSGFLALGRKTRVEASLQVRPSGLLWRFWELVHPHAGHLRIARR